MNTFLNKCLLKVFPFICLLIHFNINAQIDLLNFNLNGSANALSEPGCYQLTPPINTVTGSIWSENQINLSESFILETYLLLGCQLTSNDCNVGTDTDGADGIVFVLQPLSTNEGGTGQGIGYDGISPSIGIEFDTFRNTDLNDPSFDHIAVISNGDVDHNGSNNISGPVSASSTSPNVEDCQEHFVRIIWDSSTNTMEVFFDCDLRISTTINVVDIFGTDLNVFWGFTSATGGCNNDHQVCVPLPPTLEDITYDICQGDTVQINPLFLSPEYTFSWNNGNDLLDASEFNPEASPSSNTVYTLTLINECTDQLTVDYTVNVLTCDCNDVVNGTAILDACGECLEPGDPAFDQSCLDCNGVANGTAEIDDCGVCLDPGDSTFNQSCADCAGTPNGTFLIDNCGFCLDPDDPAFDVGCIDCNGTLNGTFVLDECGVCLEPGDPDFNQSCLDCNGTINGTFIIDDCGVCLDSNDAAFNASCTDCNGTPNGDFQINDCGDCLSITDPSFNLPCENKVLIPTAFSPNGDGVNDEFGAEIIGIPIAYSLSVYNRWGKRVFNSNQQNESWKGEDEEMGVYMFYIQVIFDDESIFTAKGTITLVK